MVKMLDTQKGKLQMAWSVGRKFYCWKALGSVTSTTPYYTSILEVINEAEVKQEVYQ